MGIFTKQKKQIPKLNYNENTFNEYDALKNSTDLKQAQQNTNENLQSYEDYLSAKNELQDFCGETDLDFDNFQKNEYEHFRIKEYDYTLNYDYEMPEEIGFDDEIDVNYEITHKVPLIKQIIKGQSKFDALMGVAEVLKPKFNGDE